MNTDKGMNWIALLVLVYQGVSTIPDGVAKHILTGLTLTAISVVAFATKGSGLSQDQTKDVLDASRDLQDVLGQGRED